MDLISNAMIPEAKFDISSIKLTRQQQLKLFDGCLLESVCNWEKERLGDGERERERQ